MNDSAVIDDAVIDAVGTRLPLPSRGILPALIAGGVLALLLGCGSESATAHSDSPVPEVTQVGTVASTAPDLSTPDLSTLVAWLWSQQDEDGAWRGTLHPYFRKGHALTPYVLHALLAVPEDTAPRPDGGVARALEFIRSTIATDGSVGRDGVPVAEYPNYATAYALRCLVLGGDPTDDDRIARLRDRLLAEQFRTGNGFGPEDPVHGGWGFGVRPPDAPGHMDVSYTRHVLEALAEAGALSEDPAVGERAAHFLRFVQRHPDDARTQPPFDDGPRAVPFDGGFYFSPIMETINKAGVAVDPTSGVRFYASYASATCEGVLALSALGCDREDPRVVAARRWLVDLHPRIDRHEGIPEDEPNGWRDALRLYHLAVRAETHAALGGPEGWRETIARELAPYQRGDGSFVNPAGGAMKEDEPLLASALALIALSGVERTPR